jgi:hypothetical protein
MSKVLVFSVSFSIIMGLKGEGERYYEEEGC